MIDHSTCDHPKTKAGRAKCRKDRVKAAAPEAAKAAESQPAETAQVEETAETVHVVEDVAQVEDATAEKPAPRRSRRAKAEVA